MKQVIKVLWIWIIEYRVCRCLLFNDAKRVRYLFIRHLRDTVPTLLSRINHGAWRDRARQLDDWRHLASNTAINV